MPNSIAKYVTAWAASPFGGTDDAPWAATAEAPDRIRLALNRLGPEFVVSDEVAIHHSATIEVGAVIKGPHGSAQSASSRRVPICAAECFWKLSALSGRGQS